MVSLAVAALGLLVAFIVSRLIPVVQTYLSIRAQPWRFALAPAFGAFGMIFLPESWRVDYGTVWNDKFNLFRKQKVTGFFAFSPFYSRPTFVVADPGAIKTIGQSPDFSKLSEIYVGVSHWDANLLNTELVEWRRHRKVVAPAFSEDINTVVWDETIRICDEWFSAMDTQCTSGGSFTDREVLQTTMRVALLVISSAAFGKALPWIEAVDSTMGKTEPSANTFSKAIVGMTSHLLLKAVVPTWAYKLPIKPVRRMVGYFDEFESYMLSMIRERRQEQQEGVERDDIFSRLIAASDAEEGLARLTERELLSNVYIILFAGHETTGHTLTAALLLLALYPEMQDVLLKEAQEIFGASEHPGYSCFAQLKWSQATFYETLRLFPPAIAIPRRALVDTHLVVHDIPSDPTAQGEPRKVFLPAMTDIYMDSVGLGYNPFYWDKPDEFIPSRFIDTPTKRWNREAFVPFATGSRACIGQKFANVEMVAALSKIVLKYKILPPEDRIEEYKTRDGETQEERLHRLYKAIQVITLTPVGVGVVFEKRT